MNEDERKSIREMLNGFNTQNCLGFTGDLKQWNENYGYIDDIRVTQNTTRFLNYLNYKIYKNTFRRKNKKLKVIPTVEGSWSSNKRYHVHLVMEKPPTNVMSHNNFMESFFNCWNKTYYSYDKPHIYTYIDNGWIDYITKFKEKDDFVDWKNVTL